jgi:hypothetical protein
MIQPPFHRGIIHENIPVDLEIFDSKTSLIPQSKKNRSGNCRKSNNNIE